MNKKITEDQARRAHLAALDYLAARRAHNPAAQARDGMFDAVGYWMQPRIMSSGQFRGERGFPQMLRMPAGRSVRWPWDVRKAVAAWATWEAVTP